MKRLAMRESKQSLSKVSLAVIGAGRLGTALALALGESGYNVQAIVCRRLSSAKRAAALIGGAVLPLTPNRLNELPQTELVLMTTPDDVIAEVAANLAGVQKRGYRPTVLHTSGALSSSVLAPLRRRGSHTGSLHPLTSVSNPLDGRRSLRGAFYCVEGDRQAVATATRIVRTLGGQSFSINSDKKPLYHAAAVMAAGHTVALFDIASEMLEHCGLKRTDAERVLLPLLRSTVANVERSGASGALTGTFDRGDVSTVKEHLRSLRGERLEDALMIYRLLGLRSLQISPKRKKNATRFAELKRLLSDQK
jgi:predicted short-subunit dehydrogenase-like oxidoreductase (DUF2520 family)